MPMFWRDSNQWKETIDLYVRDNNQWKQTRGVWIHDGLDWRLAFAGNTTLTSANVVCLSGGTPEDGNFTASWSYTSVSISDWIIRIEARFSGGSWALVDTTINPEDLSYTSSVEGFAGFTSLENTDFRISLLDAGTEIVHAFSSPRIVFGPISC